MTLRTMTLRTLLIKLSEKANRIYEQHILSLRTVQAREFSLDKEQTSYDDLLDALG